MPQPWEDDGNTSAVKQLQPWEDPAGAKPSFIEKVKDDAQKRNDMYFDVQDQGHANGQGAIRTGLQMVGTGPLGLINDVAGDAAGSLYETVIPASGRENAAMLGHAIANTDTGKAIGGAIGAGVQKFNDAVPEGTPLRNDLNAAGNALGVASMIAPAARTAEGALTVAKNSPRFAGDLVRDIRPDPLRTADEIRSEASKAYQFADNAGGVLSAKGTDKFIGDVMKVNPADEWVPSNPSYQRLVDFLAEKQGRPMSLNSAQNLDVHLNDLIRGETDVDGYLTTAGNHFKEIQNSLRNLVHEPDPQFIEGGPQGFEAWKQARTLWKKQAQMRDVERIYQKAEGAQNKKQAIQTGFRQLASNAKKLRSYSPEEISAIENASKSGMVPDFLSNVLGSRLNGVIGGAVNGPMGAIAGDITSRTARELGGSAQMRRANKVAKLIGQDSHFVEPPAAPGAPAGTLMLPAPGPEPLPRAASPINGGPAPTAPMQADSFGNARPLAPEEVAANAAKREGMANIGLTPDVTGNIYRNELRKKFGGAFDALDLQRQELAAKQVEEAWKQNPQMQIGDVIDQALANQQDIAQVTGAPQGMNAMQDAFVRARTPQEIAAMKPQDAINYLNRTKGK